MKTYILTVISLLMSAALPGFSQQVSAGVSLTDFANVGTLNAEVGVGVSQHVSLTASVRINPWTFNGGDAGEQKENRHQTYSAGVRWWPWHVNSGWWVAAKGQYEEYNRGGFTSRRTEEGDAWGAGAAFGYALMLSSHVNVDFGLGAWGGYRTYAVYSCPTCGRVLDKGARWFLLPNEAIMSLTYVF